MLFLAAIVVLTAANAMSGIIYGKMWMRNRIVDRSYGSFNTAIVANLFVACCAVAGMFMMP